MPYQNGRKVCGYLRKRQYKLSKKNRWRVAATTRYAFGYYMNKPYKQLYRSESRKLFKRQTNKRLRQIRGDNLPSVPSGYRRQFDYWWQLY